MTAVMPPPPPPSAPPPPGGPAAPTPAGGSARTPRITRSAAPAANDSAWWPTTEEWFDLGGLLLLIGLGLYGFQSAYGGSRYLVAGLIGTLLGLAVALWGARTRQPLIVVSAATVGVFFLFGGAVAVPDQAIAGFLPSPAAVLGLIDGAISGWAKLLTTTPPVGTRDNLLVIPYLSGLLAAVVALTITRRTRRGEFALLPALGVLALSILFGTNQPASLLLQGALFAVVAIGWVSMHRRMERRVDIGTGRSGRALGTVTMLVLAGLAAVLFGSSIPGAGTRPRVVLRDQTEPPFDPRNHPSPLSSFRRYADKDNLRDTTLFTVEGLKSGDRLRLATMDSYDGEVFRVGSGAGSSGWFQRVGDQAPNPMHGRDRKVTVTVDDYDDIWVPGVGYMDDITFAGKRAEELRDDFRYNASTGVGASMVRLQKGDRYTMQYVPVPTDAGKGASAKVDQPDVRSVPGAAVLASEYDKKFLKANHKSSAYQRVSSGIVDAGINVDGASSDDRAGPAAGPSRPGHHLGRLEDMVGDESLQKVGYMLGDDEQYAPLVTLMSRDLGIPARVVMGFVVPAGHTGGDVAIKGGDVKAWVEVAIKDVGWVPITNIKPQNQEPKRKSPQDRNTAAPPPPPPPTLPPTDDEDDAKNKTCATVAETATGVGTSKTNGRSTAKGKAANKEDCPPPPPTNDPFVLPAWVYATGAATLIPISVLAAITGVIAGLKSRRRTRRRRTGPPSTRVAGGWNEVIDLAADMGSPIPVLATRSEGARLMGTDAAISLAGHADVGIFGPTDLTDGWVDQYWDDVDRTRVAMTADMSRMERWRVLVSLASLRSSFDRWRLQRRDRRVTVGNESVDNDSTGNELAGRTEPGPARSARPEATTSAGRGDAGRHVDAGAVPDPTFGPGVDGGRAPDRGTVDGPGPDPAWWRDDA